MFYIFIQYIWFHFLFPKLTGINFFAMKTVNDIKYKMSMFNVIFEFAILITLNIHEYHHMLREINVEIFCLCFDTLVPLRFL